MVLSDRPSAFAFNDSADLRYPYNLIRSIVREPTQPYGHQNEKPKRQLGPEAILHKAWRNAGLEHARVRGRDGHSYRIVYGGKPGGSLGPDFTDAVVERDDGTTFRGDVEIHVRESDWRAHGHHTDPRYNGVVLHVVASESSGRPALKATGSSIPLLALNWNRPERTSSRSRSPATELSGRLASELTDKTDDQSSAAPRLLLDLAGAGLERFHSQAAGIALEIEAFGADQALWLGVMGSLGYPRNKRAFRTVGTRIGWEFASSCESVAELEILLLHASGLPGPAGSSKPRRLPVRGSAPDWVRPFGRPANAPGARIKAVSALVPMWANQSGISRFAQQVVSNSKQAKDLWKMFRPPELIEDKKHHGTRISPCLGDRGERLAPHRICDGNEQIVRSACRYVSQKPRAEVVFITPEACCELPHRRSRDSTRDRPRASRNKDCA